MGSRRTARCVLIDLYIDPPPAPLAHYPLVSASHALTDDRASRDEQEVKAVEKGRFCSPAGAKSGVKK
jgi:hypothetical protein